mmetsp:Transcript_10439/g.20716  ORF Transcript_10439/g.20716 Transcript_10439/m.20716 type:complete len:246 (-) Transcript_10439:873-1610(-)
MPAHVNHVIDAPSDPEVPILVNGSAIASEVVIGVRLQVSRHVSIVVSLDRPAHSWPWFLDRKDTLDLIISTLPLHFFAILRIEQDRLDAEERERGTSWFCRSQSRKRRQHDAACFRLPVRVNDGAFSSSNHVVVPLPRLGVDGFTNTPKHPQGAEVILVGRLRSVLHQGTNGGGSRVEGGDLVPLHHVPVPACIRIERGTLEHERSRAVAQRAVHDVAVSRDPSDIGNTGVDIIVVNVEDVLVCE